MHSPCDADQLRDDRAATDYYDQRYTGEYMQDWPEAKIRRVTQLVRSLDLGERGVAIDFGCGVGVFSRVLADALPGWTIIGLEISPNALAAAKQNHPDIDFRLLQETDLESIQADFIFSHHVLEHVIDLDQAWSQIRAASHDHTKVLHILPCGDPDSFEHRLAAHHRNGIDPDIGNRFFYEDPGHVRRLTWQGLCDAAEPHGYAPAQVRYANHFWGGLAWISKTPPAKAAAMANPSQAAGATSRIKLTCIRASLVALSTCNRWSAVWQWRKQNATGLRGFLGLALGWPAGLLGTTVRTLIDRLAHREWQRDNTTTGSEMYALVQRDPALTQHQANPSPKRSAA